MGIRLAGRLDRATLRRLADALFLSSMSSLIRKSISNKIVFEWRKKLTVSYKRCNLSTGGSKAKER